VQDYGPGVAKRAAPWISLTGISLTDRPSPPALAVAPPRDVFLLGSSYSGTTHLGGLLEANLDAVYAGEVAHLPTYVDRHRLFDTPLGCLLCSATGRTCPRWTTATVAAVDAAGPSGAAQVLRTAYDSRPRLVVDGSKWPEWLRLALQDRPRELPAPVAVLCARSPFGYAMSARGASGEPAWVVAAWWRDVYVDALRTLNLFGVPYVVVRNEDVRRDPGSALDRVARLTGQPEPEELRPAVPTHSIGGNVFVQHGYHASSVEVLDRLGLVSPDAGTRLAATWQTDGAAMSTGSTTTAVARPRSRDEALGFASAVTQCPGLVEVMQTLGYSLSAEIETFLGAAAA
jgi:hypothetical protein